MDNIIQEGICVLVDGGCRNNNQPVTNRVMYGSMIVYFNGKQISHTKGGMQHDVRRMEYQHQWDHASNQVAELLVVVDALDYLTQLNDRKPITHKVTVMSDSEYALGHARAHFKVGSKTSWTIKRLRQTLDSLFINLEDQGVEVEFEHVGNVFVKSVLGH